MMEKERGEAAPPPKWDCVRLVSVELEGGWVAPSITLVKNLRDDQSLRDIRGDCVGEISNTPFPPEKAYAWVRRYCPQHVNSTCGTHVHMSTHTAAGYSKLLSVSYQRHLLDALEEWGTRNKLAPSSTFWERLSGQNRFCLRRFDPGQIHMRDKHEPGGDRRRTVINYPFGIHGTVEVRVGPGFSKPDLAVSYVKEVVEQTNLFLKRAKPVSVSCVVSLEED